MKIGFMQDMCPLCNDGGAQMNDRRMILKGLERGHEIEIITPQNIGLRSMESYDLLILSNCVTFPREILQKACEKVPYITFTHDYYFCRYRLYYPMLEKCKSCINKPFWEKIYKNAKLNIFLSSLHYEAHEFVFGEEVLKPRAIVPSNIDIEKFKPVEGVERKKNTVVGINCLAVFKGRYNIHHYAQEHPEMEFTFVGRDPEIRLPNCKYIAYMPNAEMPKFLSQFEYFIHLPSTPQPCERTIIEAFLCGCKLIANENIGILSYSWNWKNKEDIKFKLRQAGIGFWEEIEKAVK